MRAAAALAASLVTLAALAGNAHALTIRGTHGPDRLRGTPAADSLFGLGGNDRIAGSRGDDLLHGGTGRDEATGGPGADRFVLHGDAAFDRAFCGAGRDIVKADLRDSVGRSCEVVSRALSRDTFANEGSQHRTQVEPDSFAAGSTIVTVFQVARFIDGGAAGIGFATSRDRGRSWRSGILPGLSIFSAPPGPATAITDPAVAYDAARRTWVVATLGISEGGDLLLISRSRDGVRWSAPVVAARGEGLDKEWITCDNWASSGFRGHCYLSYLDTVTGQIATRTSVDGGTRWSAPVSAAGPPGRARFVNGAYPVVRPDGTLVVLYTDFAAYVGAPAHRIEAIRSTDGGATFGTPVRVADLFGFEIRGVRSPQFVSADVDANGRIFAAWHDCRFSEDCSMTDVVLASSQNGVTWTEPRLVPTTPVPDLAEEFVPALAVDPARAGRLAVLYHAVVPCGAAACIDVGLVSSADAGARWRTPQRLNAESMPLQWIAESSTGKMLADYVSVSFLAGRPVPVFALASQPSGETLEQSIFALVRGSG